jgi:hypothetical protein
MRSELNQIEYIERYLEGKLTPNEQSLFEEMLSTDESLRQNTELQKQLADRIKVNAFRNEIAGFHATYTAKKVWSFKAIWLNVFIGFLLVGTTSASIYYLSKFDDKKESLIITDKGNRENKLASNTVTNSQPLVAVNETENKPEEKNSDLVNRRRQIIEPKDDQPPVQPKVEIPKDETPCKNFILPFNTQIIDASLGGNVVTKDSKSTLQFEPNSLVDKNGNTVSGKVEIRYREYRNSAQTAYSQIPMNYVENNETYNFNSAGMFEVRAFQNGEPVNVKPGNSFKVDYNVTNKVDSCFFFAMNDETRIWRKLQPIKFRKIEKNTIEEHYDVPDLKREEGQVFIRVKNYSGELINLPGLKDSEKGSSIYRPKNDSGYQVLIVKPGMHSVTISQAGYKKLRIKNIHVPKGKIVNIDAQLAFRQYEKVVKATKVGGSYKIKDSTQCAIDFALNKAELRSRHFRNRRKVENGLATDLTFNDNGNRKDGTLLAEGSSDPGHTYPNMVKGLQCSSFGVYNCDQIMRVPDRLAVKATYKDEIGREIDNGHVLSMIDLNYNGAFSFSPQSFSCSKSGRNVLLLFTKDSKVYVVNEEEYKKKNVTQSGTYDFTMSDITDKVTDSEELRKYLGLK